MQVTLIYITDPWHSFKSRELIGVATTTQKRDTIIRKALRESLYSKPDREKIANAIKEINENGQTFSLAEKHDIEFDTETVETNILLP